MTEPLRRVPKARHLFIARLFEQAALGAGSLLLAGVLGVDDFAPISLLIVINSFAVIASDFGLGLAIMRLPPDHRVALRSLHQLRAVNGAITVAGILAGAAIGGTNGWLVALSALTWSTSAEAFVRKSAALRLMAEKRVALAEGLGAVAFLLIVCASVAEPSWALPLTGFAFAAKQIIEAAVSAPWRDMFAVDGEPPAPWALLGTQVLAFAIRNVDFLIVGAVFAPAVFSVYVLAWRAANLAPAQLARVATRVSMVSFAENEEHRQELYDRYVRNLFGLGLAGGALTAAAAPLLPLLLGESWRSATGVIIVLAIAVPFRMVLGISVSLAMASGVARHLMGWEVARLALNVAFFAAAATFGFPALVAAVALMSILPGAHYNVMFARRSGLRPAPYLLPAAVVASILAVLGASLITTPT